jgi:hypothetical protein
MLAKSLGLAALAAGYTVRFVTLAAALADLLQQESMPAFERRLKRYVRPQVTRRGRRSRGRRVAR